MVGSTDMGDLTHLMPAVQLLLGGFCGQQHGADFKCADLKATCLQGAQLLAGTVLKLLGDDAAGASSVLKSFDRVLTDDQYYEYMDK